MVAPGPLDSRPLRVVVTLGTLKYDFGRLVRRLVAIMPPDTEVLWQYGRTDVSGLGLVGEASLPEPVLAAAMRNADVVVTHAGVGSALTALESGRLPVMVPRLRRFGEHVDDHQTQIAHELQRRGLAHHVTPEGLTQDALRYAAGFQVVDRAKTT